MIRVMIMAGGTGGHVYPALSIAFSLQKRGVDVVWLGTERGLEHRLVPAAGLHMECLDVSAWMGTSWRKKIAMPWILLRAIAQSIKIIRRFKPGVVLGMGGFAAGPGGLAAWLLRRPLVIHEANARGGLTNRLLAPLAQKILTGFSTAEKLPASAIWTGNPVRPEIASIAAPADRGLGEAAGLRVLVLGGSQGARSINQSVPVALAQCVCAENLQILHQSGPGQEAHVRATYDALSLQVTVAPFIDDMAGAYAQADLVIARAGAMTVSEVCAVGLPAILIPYPFAADDHQLVNASFLLDAKAAIVIEEKDLDLSRLSREVDVLFGDRPLLHKMATAARSLARSDATETVMSHCLEVAHA